MSKNDKTLKVILVGDPHTGKTSIINQYINQTFSHEYLMTVGQDSEIKKLTIDSNELTLHIWDTAGQEQYSALNKLFIKKTNICILVYDITSKTSFNNLSKWYNDVLSINKVDDLIFAIAANKSDLYENEQVKVEEGEKYAKSINAIFIETSAINFNCIEILFQKAVEEYYNKFLKKNDSDNNNNNNNNTTNEENDLNGKTIEQMENENKQNENKKKKCCDGKKKNKNDNTGNKKKNDVDDVKNDNVKDDNKK